MASPWHPHATRASLGLMAHLSLLCAEWFATSTDSYILRDLDDTSVVEDGRKKLNTLAHYKVSPQGTAASRRPPGPGASPPRPASLGRSREVAIAPPALLGNRHLPWRGAR